MKCFRFQATQILRLIKQFLLQIANRSRLECLEFPRREHVFNIISSLKQFQYSELQFHNTPYFDWASFSTALLISLLTRLPAIIALFLCKWLRPDVLNSELCSNYTISRCDCSDQLLPSGGGLFIAVKASLRCTSVSLNDSGSLEQIVVLVNFPISTIHLCDIYIRTTSPTGVYSMHATAIQKLLFRIQRYRSTRFWLLAKY